MFDMPIPFKVLHAHAAIAALGVNRVAAAGFTRAVVNAVDAGSVDTRSAGDEDDVACRHEDGGGCGYCWIVVAVPAEALFSG